MSEWTWVRWNRRGTPHYWNLSIRLFSIILWHSLGRSYPSNEKQSVDSTVPAKWVRNFRRKESVYTHFRFFYYFSCYFFIYIYIYVYLVWFYGRLFYARMLRAILNKSWRQHPTRHQRYGHLPPITKTVQVRRTRHAGHCWRSKDELVSDVLQWTPHMAKQKQDDQLEPTYSSYVKTQDVTLKTCRRRWMIGRSGEIWSGISVLAARHDDDDDFMPNTVYSYI